MRLALALESKTYGMEDPLAIVGLLVGLVLTWIGYRISIWPVTARYGIQPRAASSTG